MKCYVKFLWKYLSIDDKIVKHTCFFEVCRNISVRFIYDVMGV